ncbi:MAG: CHASE2 domain-containing protein, partial [Pseudomonadota bacterium]
MLQRLGSILKSPIIRWVTGVTLLVSILLLWRPTFTEFMELKLYDLKFRVRGPQPASQDVVILGIDDDSLKAVGRWPWSRDDMARLVSRLQEAGPRVIVLDIIFAEKQETATVRTLANLCQEIAKRGGTEDIVALLEKEQQRLDVDRILADIISKNPPTILGFFFRRVGGTTGGVEKSQLMAPSFIRASTYNVVRLLDTEPSRVPLIGADGVELNLPEISEAAAGAGYFNMMPDVDGTVRWFPMTILYGADFFAPMSLVALAHYRDNPTSAITLSRVGVESIRLGNQEVPVDRHGRMLINYLGPPGIVPTYSAKALLEGSLPAEALKDKIVLVGATAVGIYDLRVTPFSGVSPGVEVQATVLDNLLRSNFIRVPKFGLPLMLLILLGLGVLLGLLLPQLSAAWAFVFTLLLIEGVTFSNYFLFSRLGIQLELFYPLMEIVGVYLGITMQRFLAEERERLRIRKAFESYVAPAVVQEMLKHPEALRLGGERRVITVLFTDIRGFTTMSEGLDPEALVKLLHDFLNPMSNIIIDQGGTIDKYMGDAIMALFGAPLEQPDHARQACRAALQMEDTLEELNRQWAKQGRPPLRIGVGVNSGPAAVGNMGSDRLFDYTAIGDNVNLASRLEGLTKYYGTNILISQATAEALENGFILRDVDRVKVKGKAQASGIFEVMCEGEPDPELARFLTAYHQGLALYRQMRWPDSIAAFEKALEVQPDDAPSRRYLALARKHQETPPEPEWEAVTVMDEK